MVYNPREGSRRWRSEGRGDKRGRRDDGRLVTSTDPITSSED